MDTHEKARGLLLEPSGLDESSLEKAMSQLLVAGIDYGDIYIEQSRSESWVMEAGIIREGAHRASRGAGIRANAGEKTGFAHSDELTLDALLDAAKSARAIARSGKEGQLRLSRSGMLAAPYDSQDPLAAVEPQARLELLRRLDRETRSLDSRISEVTIGLTASHTTVLIAASDGTLASDIRPLLRLNISVIMEDKGRRESGSFGGGGRYSLAQLLADDAKTARNWAGEAVRQAQVAMQSEPAPAGSMVVVLGPGWPGILLHEAIGHGLEGDFNRKGTSAFSGRIGEQIAASGCTVVDDGTLHDRRGSLSVDDEGTPTSCTTLIENGVLREYMQDKLNARLSGNALTGNGRRQSYAHRPMPRMTNTYMLPGNAEPGDIIESVADGLYAVNFGGGQVDITSGRFVFSASEAYRIRNGRVCEPVKGATLIGNGAEVLKKISMIGNDLALDSGVGTCGKDGQQVPVGVGQPTLRIDGLTVGGTSS